MINENEHELIVEQADEYESLKTFRSGIKQMDDFIHKYLAVCSTSHFCVTYYVRLQPKGKIVALFSLSNDSVDLDGDDFYDMRIGAAGTELPLVDDSFRERFEQKCTYPALEITYLAVQEEYQGLKIGTALIDFIANMARNRSGFGCVFLTVNALHSDTYSAVPFYIENDFAKFLTVNALHSDTYSAVPFYIENDFAKLTPIPRMDVWPMYKTLWPTQVIDMQNDET